MAASARDGGTVYAVRVTDCRPAGDGYVFKTRFREVCAVGKGHAVSVLDRECEKRGWCLHEVQFLYCV